MRLPAIQQLVHRTERVVEYSTNGEAGVLARPCAQLVRSAAARVGADVPEPRLASQERTRTWGNRGTSVFLAPCSGYIILESGSNSSGPLPGVLHGYPSPFNKRPSLQLRGRPSDEPPYCLA